MEKKLKKKLVNKVGITNCVHKLEAIFVFRFMVLYRVHYASFQWKIAAGKKLALQDEM